MDNAQQSSGANGGDLRTLLFVLLAVFVSDVLLRSMENMLSGNIAHVNEITELVEDYDSSSDNSLLFLGNSLTNNGVDLPLVNELLPANGIPVGDSTKLVPDATTIWSWSCVLKNHFFNNETSPGVVILGFGWDQLSDQSRILPTRLGAFFCSAADLPSINRHRSLSSAETGEFLTAGALRTYAHRETIRNRVLSTVVPHYQSMTQSINRQQRDVQSDSNQQFSYSVLSSLIDSLQTHDSRLIVVAMPVRDNPYEVDHRLREFLDDLEIPLFDYTNLGPINDGSFLDDMHLNPEGARILSTRLAKDLAVTLALQSDPLSHP